MSFETPQAAYSAERVAHWDGVAEADDRSFRLGGYYHRRIQQIYQQLVAPGQRVLELGCGQGDLLSSVKPSVGIGVDFSQEMIRTASIRHPPLRFITADAHDVVLEEKFDVIILSDLVNDLWDVQRVFWGMRAWCNPGTRVIINWYSRVWQIPLSFSKAVGLTTPTLQQNWLSADDVSNLLQLEDFEKVRTSSEILCPVPIPVVASLCNRYLDKILPFRLLDLTNFVIARPRPCAPRDGEKPLVSVIVPARNEEGHIDGIIERVPEMGSGTELVFVEGHSGDDTYGAIERAIAAHPERSCKLFRQSGKGKGDAVRLGFREANGEILMILDADITVSPEDLPRFYEALVSGKGEFINGVRLVYPMEERSMRPMNFLGNKFFSVAFSWLLGQPIKDTLCGTKVLSKADYERIAANRTHFGDFDPFGDFDLIFGSTRLNLKIVDMPVRYGERTYGETNIQRWRHGLLLLRMVLFAARRIKFR